MDSSRKILTPVQLTVLIIFFVAVITFLLLKDQLGMFTPHQDMNTADSTVSWKVPDINELPEGEDKELIKYGRDLLNNTCLLIGPMSSDSSMRYAGNNLVCSNCHFDAGTNMFSYNLVGVTSRFPQYSERDKKMESIQERLNDCMERSMNGKPLPVDSREMKAMVAYLKFISKYVPKGYKVDHQGIPNIPPPPTDPDPVKGGEYYDKYCSTCHGGSGEGARNDPYIPGQVKYRVPPLWGSDSYNDGAGMSTREKAAKFIYHVMPFDDKNSLTLEKAYDIEAFINSQPRPKF
mgnify:CR=1 FL=1